MDLNHAARLIRARSATSTSRPSGPGERYALGTTEPAFPSSESSELPESYGTQRLLLVERATGDTRGEMPTIGVPAATGLQQAQRGALNYKSCRRRRAGCECRYRSNS